MPRVVGISPPAPAPHHGAGNWAPYLESALALRPSYPYPTNGAEVVAALLERAAYEWKDVAPAGASGRRSVSPVWEEGQASGSGSARLRDIVVCGYVMQRHASREQVGGVGGLGRGSGWVLDVVCGCVMLHRAARDRGGAAGGGVGALSEAGVLLAPLS